MSKNALISVLAILFAFTNLGAQQQLRHEKKIYRSPEGKLYIQKLMPVYVRIATSPNDEAQSYLLKSETSAKYSNPMYFDTDGFNSFRSPSRVDTATKKPVFPKEDIIFEVYADNSAPGSTIKFGNNDTRKIKDKTYLRGKATITLLAKDALSGVENIYYSIDAADYKKYDAPFTLDAEKEYIIKYYSVDNVGNVENINTIKVVTDLSSPKTSYHLKGDFMGQDLAGNVSITFKAEDMGSGLSHIKYKLDDGPEKNYSSPILAAFLEQGDHKIVFYSTDQVNNKENENTFEFYVDKTPPTIIQEITGKSFIANGREYSSGRSQLKITALDNKAGVKEIYYAINNGKYKLYEKPVTLANTSGNLSVKSYATDNVNNRAYSDDNNGNNNSKKNITYVDLSGPKLSYQYIGPTFIYNDTVFINHKTKILLKGTDNESGFNRIEYAINQGENAVYENPLKITKEGKNTIQFTGFDNIDNTSNESFSFIADTTGPVITYTFTTPPIKQESINNETIEIYPKFASIFVSVTDKYTGFGHMTYSFNNTPEKIFTGYIQTLPSNKAHQLIINAYDNLGNRTSKIIRFGVE